MRIWSIHPKHLDTKGLVALWRETLLAKNVLSGNTRGYVNHPQLIRFKESKDPLKAINYYLQMVWEEAQKRGYNFNSSKFTSEKDIERIPVTEGQLEYETAHLMNKLAKRDVTLYRKLEKQTLALHPLFEVTEGPVESWEKVF